LAWLPLTPFEAAPAIVSVESPIHRSLELERRLSRVGGKRGCWGVVVQGAWYSDGGDPGL
jgi:hypothetical protein